MTTKKAQSALEYMMTYGWAIVIILLVLLVLFYLGILNPAGFVATRNQVAGLNAIMVTDFVVNGTTGNMTLYLVNNVGSSINLYNISVNNIPLVPMSPPGYSNWRSGQNLTFNGNSSVKGKIGDSFYNVPISFNYSIINGGNHLDSGIMSGKLD